SSKRAAEKNAENSTPNSSAVRRRAVVTRQSPTIAPLASNAPSFVSVLPTSMQSSTSAARPVALAPQPEDLVEQPCGELALRTGAEVGAPVVAPEQHETVRHVAETALAAHVVDRDRVEVLARELLARVRFERLRLGGEPHEEQLVALRRAEPGEDVGVALERDRRHLFGLLHLLRVRRGGAPVGDGG